MLDGTVLSAKTFFFFLFLAEEWWGKYRISRRSLFKPADEMRVISRTCGRESSIWIRCVWTWKFLNPERKICGFKNIQIRVDGGLREVSDLSRVDLCHCFFLQACSFDQLRRGSTQLCSEVDIVGVVVFCAPLSCFSNLRYACNHGYKVVPVHLFNSMLSSSASSSSFFRCRPRHHHRHHGRHHHHYVTFNLTLLKKC